MVSGGAAWAISAAQPKAVAVASPSSRKFFLMMPLLIGAWYQHRAVSRLADPVSTWRVN
jgi:hypothetical protein